MPLPTTIAVDGISLKLDLYLTRGANCCPMRDTYNPVLFLFIFLTAILFKVFYSCCDKEQRWEGSPRLITESGIIRNLQEKTQAEPS